VTAYHVVADARTIDVICTGGQQARAVIERFDPANDLALLKLSQATPAFLEMQQITLFHWPEGIYRRFSRSPVTRNRTEVFQWVHQFAEWIYGVANPLQITVPIQPGNSGGHSSMNQVALLQL
jgi:S1-C subfamily serine protease